MPLFSKSEGTVHQAGSEFLWRNTKITRSYGCLIIDWITRLLLHVLQSLALQVQRKPGNLEARSPPPLSSIHPCTLSHAYLEQKKVHSELRKTAVDCMRFSRRLCTEHKLRFVDKLLFLYRKMEVWGFRNKWRWT